jgi:hypothetical protein
MPGQEYVDTGSCEGSSTTSTKGSIMTTARTFHLISTIGLAIGFLGVGAVMFDANHGPEGGGANIGLGLLMPLCLGSGVVGIATGVAALVTTWSADRATRSRQPRPGHLPEVP